jgi:acetylcholinesterase
MLYSSPGDTHHTPQTYALSEFMRSAFSQFIKNPVGGPGWPAVGTEKFGTADVAILGDASSTLTSGAVVVRHEVLDEKCSFYKPVLDGMAGYSLP